MPNGPSRWFSASALPSRRSAHRAARRRSRPAWVTPSPRPMNLRASGLPRFSRRPTRRCTARSWERGGSLAPCFIFHALKNSPTRTSPPCPTGPRPDARNRPVGVTGAQSPRAGDVGRATATQKRGRGKRPRRRWPAEAREDLEPMPLRRVATRQSRSRRPVKRVPHLPRRARRRNCRKGCSGPRLHRARRPRASSSKANRPAADAARPPGTSLRRTR